MSRTTVKRTLTRNRPRRVVENEEFAAFTRRILAAYARRIAAGDVEALPGLSALSADVDVAMREAVKGLRSFGYSWAEIAKRLGVSRQAVQMRYGAPGDRGSVDRRLLTTDQGVSMSVLVAVFVDHCRGVPAVMTCAGCGHVFDEDDTTSDCPTNAVVRGLLHRRKHENHAELSALTAEQAAELKAKPRNPYGDKPPARDVAVELFAANGYRRNPRPAGNDLTRRRR